MKNFLYDIAEAQKRIKETGGRYKIFNISDLVLNDDDFKLAWKVYRSESSIIFGEDSELTSEGVFHGLVYCLLTPLQNYFGQSKGFEAFFNEGLATPEKIQENLGMLGVVFKEAKVMFPDQKANYIEIAAQNWNNLNLLEKIGRSVNTDREQETHLRKNIVENVKGLGNKTASILLRMCGLKYLVPIDSWMAEILYFNGVISSLFSRSHTTDIYWFESQFQCRRSRSE